MGWKDWLVGTAFALVVVFAVVTVVVVIHHERHHAPRISQSQETNLQRLCYGNLGNGGC